MRRIGHRPRMRWGAGKTVVCPLFPPLPTYIEKDFWVCRVLDGLYHGLPDDHPRLLFKGGTSLSKAFGAIRRFSEDIDVVVFRNDLGFTDDRDPTRRDLSYKARERLVGELKESASRYI